MSTRKQKLALEKTIENRGNISRSMLEAGYSPATAKNPKNLTGSKGWQDLLGSVINEEILIERVYAIAMQDDKRAALQAVDMLLKLRDRYPAGKLKIHQFEEELSAVIED